MNGVGYMDMSIIGALENVLNGYKNTNVQDVKSENFNKFLKWAEEQQKIDDMCNEIVKEFHTPVNVVDFACKHTDDTAVSYDLAMIDRSAFKGANNVVISKDILLRMSEDKNYKAKVFKSIREMPGFGGMAGGMIKSTGAVIHEDGTAGYWMEFDWGDAEDDKRKKKIIISKQPITDVPQVYSNQEADITELSYISAMQSTITSYKKVTEK